MATHQATFSNEVYTVQTNKQTPKNKQKNPDKNKQKKLFCSCIFKKKRVTQRISILSNNCNIF